MIRLKAVVSWMVVVVASVALGEVLVRLLLTPPGLYPRPQETPVVTPHPVRGYALRSGASGVYRAGGQRGRIDINAAGFRSAPFSDSAAGDFRILATGDSFTMGLGVDDSDPWPEQLEKLFVDEGKRVKVINAGVAGYSARQMRQTMEELIPVLHPRVLIAAVNGETYWRVRNPYIYIGGQVVRSSVAPRLTVGPKGLYYSRITKWSWLRNLDIWMNQHFQLGAHLLGVAQTVYGYSLPPTPVDTEISPTAPIGLDTLEAVFAPVLVEIGKMDSLARAAHATLVVVMVNPQQADGSFRPAQRVYNDLVVHYCRKASIHVLDPLPLLTAAANGQPIFRTSDDYHWTREAHALMAGDLHRYLSGANLVPKSR